jgi:hypothetical protein
MLGVLVSIALATFAAPGFCEDNKVANAFNSAYADWLVARVTGLSDNASAVMNEPFRRMVALGPPAIPYIMEKLTTDPGGHFLIFALSSITGKQFSPAELADKWSNQEIAALWVKWWQAGAGREKTAFEQANAKWLQSKAGETLPLWTVEVSYDTRSQTLELKETPVTPAGKAYLAIQYEGIAVLPYLADQFRAGNYDFADIALKLADQQRALPHDAQPTAEDEAKAFLAWWDANKEKWTIPWSAGNETPAPPAAAAAGG